jgi:hypothetical protein
MKSGGMPDKPSSPSYGRPTPFSTISHRGFTSSPQALTLRCEAHVTGMTVG